MKPCTRCNQFKPHVFFIAPDVPGFALANGVPLLPPKPIVASCVECLSDDEAAKILYPVALFVIQRLLEGKFSHMRGLGEIQHFEYVASWLLLQCGVEINERNKALKSLCGLAG